MKTKIVPVRMDETMLKQLDVHIDKLKLRDRSKLIREAVELLLKSDQPQVTRTMASEFQLWRKEFHGVGSNLNQLAYRMNADHPLSTSQIVESLDDLHQTFQQLAENMKRMRNELDI